MGQSIEGYT
ncbi:rCG52149 [Rattus norvegicus]|uniref:RCG52149 n=1 Tax=Rattus norvegicus TaxID=10116 RepID=A6K6I5_RAT|nr:rCG52149 [Rattus norvegicus]